MRAASVILLLTVVAASPVPAQQPLQSVVGTVRSAAGTPLAGVIVEVGGRSGTSNAQGAFQVDSLRPGRFLMTVRAVGFLPVRKTVQVLPGGESRFDLILQPAVETLPTIIVEARRTGIYGTVADSALRPLAGIMVHVTGPGGGEVPTDSTGRFAFPRASNGQFVVWIRTAGFGERWTWLSLGRDEGRELAFRLIPARTVMSKADDEAMRQLGERLAFNPPRERMSGEELHRYGSLGLCEVNRILEQLTPDRTRPEFRRKDVRVVLVLNGTTVLEEFPLLSVCSWKADEVELVEFGSSVCRDVTRSIPEMVRTWCSGVPPSSRRRAVVRSMVGSNPGIRTQGDADMPFVVIWEKR